MALRDYTAWHEDYDQPGSALYLRLLVVQDLIALALEHLAPGPVRAISMCAGQGRDLITVTARHRRGGDLMGRLVELDGNNVATARSAIEQIGLERLEVVEADAGISDAYAAATPADLVLACGVFGNISDEDIERTITFLPSLCASGAWVIWTRFPRPDGIVGRIEDWFAQAGFDSETLVVPKQQLFGVGAARLVGESRPFEPGVQLFTFVH